MMVTNATWTPRYQTIQLTRLEYTVRKVPQAKEDATFDARV